MFPVFFGLLRRNGAGASLPVATVTLSPPALEEGGQFTATVTLTGGTGPASVSYAITGENSLVDVDLNGTINVPDGQVSANLPIDTLDDALVAADALFTITIASPSGCTIGAPSAASATIINNDFTLPVATIALDDISKTEGSSFIATVTLTSGTGPASVAYAITGDTDDITSPLSGTILIDSGQTTGTTTITTDDDAADEDDAIFLISISDPVDCTIGVPASASATIVDDDITLPVATISVSPTPAVEGNSVFATVTLAGGTGPASVTYTITGDTDDIDIPLTGTIEVESGETEGVLTILTIDDGTDEPDADFVITLSDPVGCTLGSPSAADGVIVDNDASAGSEALFWGAEPLVWGPESLTWG